MPTYRRILLIINPNAGQRRTSKVRMTIEDALTSAGIGFETRLTEKTGDTMEFTRMAHADGFDLVMAAGGDGTLREATEGLMRGGAQVPVALVPSGTVNLVARSMGIPIDIKKAVRVLLEGRPKGFDVGYLPDHDRYFAFVTGAGYDGHLIHDTPRDLKKKLGFIAYVATGVRQAFTIRPVQVEIELDDVKRRLRAHTVMAINIGSIASLDWSFAPNVNPHDGKLNIAVLSSRSLWASIIVFLKIVTKRYHGYADLKHFQAERIKVTADPPLPVQVDGEPLGVTPFRAVVIPQGLQFIVPTDYAL